MISIQHLAKEFGNTKPLRDVNIEVNKGDVVSIIGPSGTGKSTLLRCINGLEVATSGKILINGTDINVKGCRLNLVRQKMGMVFQNFNLFSHMNIVENIMYAPMKLLGLSKTDAYDRAIKLLRIVSLEEKELSYPDELSGGQKQRIAIARALAMKPEILLFDEPTSALDPIMVGEILEVIKRLAYEGLTMIIVTHEMRLAKSVSSRVLYLDQGIVYEEGTPDEIFNNPQKDLTRRFICGQNMIIKEFYKNTLDYLGFISEINEFALRHAFSVQLFLKIKKVVEDVYLHTILPALDENTKVKFILEYSGDNENSCKIEFSLSDFGAYDNAIPKDFLNKELSDGGLDVKCSSEGEGLSRISVTVF